MARAFSIIKKRGNGTLPERFLGVFDTVGTFPKANWHKQVAAWELCSMEERDMAAALPRTPETPERDRASNLGPEGFRL
jgi:hypothetical protein